MKGQTSIPLACPFLFHTVFVGALRALRGALTFAPLSLDELMHSVYHSAHFVFHRADDGIRADRREGAYDERAAVLLFRLFFFAFGK